MMSYIAGGCPPQMNRSSWAGSLTGVILVGMMTMAPTATAKPLAKKKGRSHEVDMGLVVLDLDAVGALAMLAVGARGADDEHRPALAAARLVGRHGGIDGGWWVCLVWG
jgi:hypothetical protein